MFILTIILLNTFAGTFTTETYVYSDRGHCLIGEDNVRRQYYAQRQNIYNPDTLIIECSSAKKGN